MRQILPLFFPHIYCLPVWYSMWDPKFPDQGSNLLPPALEAENLNHWTTREVSTTGLWLERSD